MKTAAICVPDIPEHYPFRALQTGLTRLGYLPTPDWQRADALLTWSPWLGSHRAALAETYRLSGRPVIVCENGWLQPIRGRTFYQLAFDSWNGTGSYPVGGPDRWASWGVDLMPWRADPLGYSLVIGQRGHPIDDRTAKPGWHETVHVEGLRVRRRARDCAIPLEVDLAGARDVHVWTSNAASWAVINGVPVIQHGPNLAVSELASRDPARYAFPDRLGVLERLAWSQWDIGALASGEALAWLLGEAIA